VLAADLEATDSEQGDSVFGLEPDVVARLVNEVDGVIHCGANVNHVLPFTELAAANVGATQQLLRLFCMTRAAERKEPLDFVFVSTGSVARLTDGPGSCARSLVDLDDDTLVDSNVSGYALTKWAAERLVERAASALAGNNSVRLAIVRCGMTSWHTGLGHGNRRDWLYALCNGVAKLGLFPEAEWQQRTKDPLHLNVAPVDWVADCISRLMLAPPVQGAPTLAGPVPIISLSNHQHLLSLRSLFEGKLNARGVPVQEWLATVRRTVGESDGESEPAKTEAPSAVPEALKRLHATLFMFAEGAPHSDRIIPVEGPLSKQSPPESSSQSSTIAPLLLPLLGGKGSTPSTTATHWLDDSRLVVNDFTDAFALWLKNQS
jgi:thioester reductase-like protein